MYFRESDKARERAHRAGVLARRAHDENQRHWRLLAERHELKREEADLNGQLKKWNQLERVHTEWINGPRRDHEAMVRRSLAEMRPGLPARSRSASTSWDTLSELWPSRTPKMPMTKADVERASLELREGDSDFDAMVRRRLSQIRGGSAQGLRGAHPRQRGADRILTPRR